MAAELRVGSSGALRGPPSCAPSPSSTGASPRRRRGPRRSSACRRCRRCAAARRGLGSQTSKISNVFFTRQNLYAFTPLKDNLWCVCSLCCQSRLLEVPTITQLAMQACSANAITRHDTVSAGNARSELCAEMRSRAPRPRLLKDLLRQALSKSDQCLPNMCQVLAKL